MRKTFTFEVTVTVNGWMTTSQARREVRTLINDQTNYLDHGGPQNDFEEPKVRVAKITKAARTTLEMAAPDLLAALKRLSAFAEGNMNDHPSEYEEETYSVARAAIAKAEGRANG